MPWLSYTSDISSKGDMKWLMTNTSFILRLFKLTYMHHIQWHVIMGTESLLCIYSQSQAVRVALTGNSCSPCHIELSKCKCHRNMSVDLQSRYCIYHFPQLAKVVFSFFLTFDSFREMTLRCHELTRPRSRKCTLRLILSLFVAWLLLIEFLCCAVN